MKQLLFLLVAFFAIGFGATAQTVTVNGRVLYAGDDEPLVGASVVPTGSKSSIGKNLSKLHANIRKSCRYRQDLRIF